jgi:hypothetical protein
MHPAQPLAYADNTFFQGASEPTMKTYQALTALATPLKLHAQQTKGAVSSADDAATANTASYLRVRRAHNGLLAAGTLAGNPAFQADWADVWAGYAWGSSLMRRTHTPPHCQSQVHCPAEILWRTQRSWEFCTGPPPKLRLLSRLGLAKHPPHHQYPGAQE